MSPKLTGLILGTAAIAISASAFSAEPRSIWDGIYTEQQAERGKSAYDRKCLDCHGDDLLGDAEAPAVGGDEFLWKWNGLTMGQLFERVHRDMPLNNARSLSRETSADLLAYMLSVSQVPPGSAELPHDAPLLDQILITPVRKR